MDSTEHNSGQAAGRRRSRAAQRDAEPWVATEGRSAWQAVWLPLLTLVGVIAVLAGINHLVIQPLARDDAGMPAAVAMLIATVVVLGSAGAGLAAWRRRREAT